MDNYQKDENRGLPVVSSLKEAEQFFLNNKTGEKAVAYRGEESRVLHNFSDAEEFFLENVAEPKTSEGSLRALSFGEKAVGLTFNPGNNPDVDNIKVSYAKIIDALDQLRSATDSGEVKRLYATAITQAQDAQMWAVKAVTWKD